MKNFKRNQLFSLAFIVLIVSLLLYIYLVGSIYLLNKKIDASNTTLAQQNIQIEKIKKDIWYEKFNSIRDLENASKVMPWFDHITKIIDILNSLKSVDPSESDSVILTDFNVSLDTISLRWKVSNLSTLYYSSSQNWIQSLIDRFEALDFIENMSIKSYNKVEDGYFEFVLQAKIINDASK